MPKLLSAIEVVDATLGVAAGRFKMVMSGRLRIERRLRESVSETATAHRLAPEIDSNALARRIQRLEQGKRPDLALANSLARLFGTTLPALVAETELSRRTLDTFERLSNRDRIRAWRRVRDPTRDASRFPRQRQ